MRAIERVGTNRNDELARQTSLVGQMTSTEVVTLTVAIVGAVLGVLNTWHNFRKDRVRLRVIPKVNFVLPNGLAITASQCGERKEDILRKGNKFRLCIEVLNLSSFPVTVSMVGFGRATRHGRQVIVNPSVNEGRTWPARLQPRESVTAFAALGVALDPKTLGAAVAFAETDCDKLFYGTSQIFKWYVREWLAQGGPR